MVWFWRQAISLRKTIDNCYILSRMRCCLTFYISFCFAPLQRCCLTVFHEQYTHSNALTSIANDSIILSINSSCCQQMSILQVEPRRKRFRGINEQKTQNTNFEQMKKKNQFFAIIYTLWRLFVYKLWQSSKFCVSSADLMHVQVIFVFLLNAIVVWNKQKLDVRNWAPSMFVPHMSFTHIEHTSKGVIWKQ